MLKCDDFIGCFGSCEKDISSGITSDFTGDFIVEYEFNGVKKTISGNATEGQEIKLPNEFIPGAIHRVLIMKSDKTKIKSLSFKIYNQCL
ncbi:hypothetical protein N6B72_05155 [Chryseobacterium soli]|uniref:hypothetical protein n=1 Tax=Chryseobacterium soli TaxID=445961 RepID=UPI0029556C18|nr:hypothetical protein [Chryseobacterium soli]MDV7696303.1 hypothetical protein [Chryseobacterium soli]